LSSAGRGRWQTSGRDRRARGRAGGAWSAPCARPRSGGQPGPTGAIAARPGVEQRERTDEGRGLGPACGRIEGEGQVLAPVPSLPERPACHGARAAKGSAAVSRRGLPASWRPHA
jgi:hypothetical protein